MDGNTITGFQVRNNTLLHSFDGKPYWVRYYADGVLSTELLRYQPVMARGSNPTQIGLIGQTHEFNPGGLITVFSTGQYWIRFTARNGWQLLPPYNVPANDPWYPRIRFNLRPVAREWARQPFTPIVPYLFASWVPGKVLAPSLMEFERQPAYFDGTNYPDILVYDKEWNLKYALDGSDPAARLDKGFLFPWRRFQFICFDEAHARCQVQVTLELTDQPWLSITMQPGCGIP